MGLVKRMTGLRKMRVMRAAVNVRPMRKIRMEAEMKRVRRPRSCGELGACSWRRRMRAVAVEGRSAMGEKEVVVVNG